MNVYDGRGLSKRLSECIDKTGLTKTEFAAKCEIPLTTLTGHYNADDINFKMNTDALFKYSKALNVSSDYLLTGEEFNANEITPNDVIKSFVIILQAYGIGIFSFEQIGNESYTQLDIWDNDLTAILKAITEFMRTENAIKAVDPKIYDETLNKFISQSGLTFIESDRKPNNVEIKKGSKL